MFGLIQITFQIYLLYGFYIHQLSFEHLNEKFKTGVLIFFSSMNLSIFKFKPLGDISVFNHSVATCELVCLSRFTLGLNFYNMYNKFFSL